MAKNQKVLAAHMYDMGTVLSSTDPLPRFDMGHLKPAAAGLVREKLIGA